MTLQQMYELLEEAHKNTNWSNRDEVRAYNEYARRLRNLYEWEKQYAEGCKY